MKGIKTKINKFAKYYSPRLGIDINYFIKGGFWLTLGQISNILKLVVLSIVFANFLSKEIYGQYSFVMAVLSIMAIFSLPGMFNAIVKSVAKGYEGTYFRGIREVFKWSWLGSLFLLGFSIYGWLTGREFGSLIFLILASIYPFYAISGYYVSFFNGKKLFDLQVKLSAIFNIISTFLIVLAVIISKNIFYIVFTTVFIQILVQGFFSTKLVKNYISNTETNKNDLKFGKRTSFSLAFSAAVDKLDYLIVTFLLGFEALAIYSIVILLPNGVKMLTNTFMPLILPKLMDLKHIKKSKILYFFKKMMIFVLFMIILYSVFSPLIFKIFYSQYYDYVNLSILFSFSLFLIPFSLFYLYFLSLGKTKLINRSFNLSSLSLFIGAIILIPILGLVGAIINRILFRVIYSLILFYDFKFKN